MKNLILQSALSNPKLLNWYMWCNFNSFYKI